MISAVKYQNKFYYCYNKIGMKANYQEKSMLTNLYPENNFLGWFGLFTIFFLGCATLIFQIKL